jgi:RNA polymerase sigma-70 factor (ECF subfamily)
VQFRNGDREAFAELYNRYRERLLWYCLRLLKDKQHAEDIVHNVFLKLQTEKETIRNTQSLRSWIFTVARNETFCELRKNKFITIDDTIIWDGDSPDEELLLKERKDAIDSVLGRLHPPFREVILLREYEHLSYIEIADITGSTVSSVKSRLFKARKALIEKLQPYFNERNV